jgi:hypothetical protein
VDSQASRGVGGYPEGEMSWPKPPTAWDGEVSARWKEHTLDPSAGWRGSQRVQIKKPKQRIDGLVLDNDILKA